MDRLTLSCAMLLGRRKIKSMDGDSPSSPPSNAVQASKSCPLTPFPFSRDRSSTMESVDSGRDSLKSDQSSGQIGMTITNSPAYLDH